MDKTPTTTDKAPETQDDDCLMVGGKAAGETFALTKNFAAAAAVGAITAYECFLDTQNNGHGSGEGQALEPNAQSPSSQIPGQKR